eukprot:PhF_6_TR40027/c0_g1_i1/m.59398
MFPGMGMPAPPPVDWGTMCWHQKVQHLVDTASDFVMSKYKWWLPSVGASIALSLVLFSPEGPVPEVMNLAMTYGAPSVQHSVFGRKMPSFEGPPGMGMDDEEDGDLEDL